MLRCHILRTPIEKSHPQLGVFLLEGEPRFLTLERPWLNNQREVSCIPEGKYLCKKTLNRRIGSRNHPIPVTFEVMNVPNRSGILFHTGNSVDDTKGCILVGETLSEPDYIEGSRDTFQYFLELMKNEVEFELNICRFIQEA